MHDVQLALTLAVTSGAGFLMVASGVHKRLLERPQARLCASRGQELRRPACERDTEVGVVAGLVTSRNPDDISAFNAKMIEEFAERTHTKQLRRKKPHAEVDLDAMEPLWSTVVATGGNRSQLGSEQARRNKPKPLPWLATSCRDERMVRRGSTARVRHRALKSSCRSAPFVPLPAEAIANAAGAGNYIRVQVLTPVNVLDRDKRLGVVKEPTEIVAAAAGDPRYAERTWVLITESPEGGWGIAGHANTNADIAAAARAALAAD